MDKVKHSGLLANALCDSLIRRSESVRDIVGFMGLGGVKNECSMILTSLKEVNKVIELPLTVSSYISKLATTLAAINIAPGHSPLFSFSSKSDGWSKSCHHYVKTSY